MRKDLLPREWQEKWGIRPMTQKEQSLLAIQDNDEFDYYVCDNWVKFILNYTTRETLEIELSNAINVDFEIKIAKKQKQSIKKFKTPKVENNLEKGQRPDIRSTIRSGSARYSSVSFEKKIKKISSRKINPFCGWVDREKAKEKVYALLSTQDDTERVFITFVACGQRASITDRNAVIWFNDLDFDMFKAQRKNFYPIVSHNLALAYCYFINEVDKNDKEKPRYVNAWVCSQIDGIEHLSRIIRN